MCWELVGQDDMEVQLHVLTCRISDQLEILMVEMVWMDRWPPWCLVEDYEGTGPSSGLGQAE